jgi:hypothetical protein
MPRFRVLAGIHVDDDGREYGPGQVVESKRDLLAQHGPEKFAAVGPYKPQAEGKKPVTTQATSFPQGQVHHGTEETTSLDEEGNPATGPTGTVRPQPEDADIPEPQRGLAKFKRGVERKAAEQSGQDEEGDQDLKETRARAEREQRADQKDRQAAEEEGSDNLESMTVQDLREVAGKEDIELHGATRKDDIVKAIRAAREE